MFHWICPECGREIAPTVRECPVCDGGAEQAELVLAGVVEASARTLQSNAPALVLPPSITKNSDVQNRGVQRDEPNRAPEEERISRTVPGAVDALPQPVKWSRKNGPSTDEQPAAEPVEIGRTEAVRARESDASVQPLILEILDAASALNRAADAKAESIRGILDRAAESFVKRSRSGEGKTIATRTIESRAAETRPVDSRPIETKSETRRIEANQIDTKPIETRLIEAKPVESTPVESKPMAVSQVEATTVAASPLEASLVETSPAETGPVESQPSENQAIETRTAAPVEPIDAVIDIDVVIDAVEVQPAAAAIEIPATPSPPIDRLPLLAKLSRLALPKIASSSTHSDTLIVAGRTTTATMPTNEESIGTTADTSSADPSAEEERGAQPVAQSGPDAKAGVMPQAAPHELMLPTFAPPPRESLNALLAAVSMLDDEASLEQPDPPLAGKLPLPVVPKNLPEIAPAVVSIGAIAPRSLPSDASPSRGMVKDVASPAGAREQKIAGLAFVDSRFPLARPTAQALKLASPLTPPAPLAPKACAVRGPRSASPFLAPNMAGLVRYAPLEKNPLRPVPPPAGIRRPDTTPRITLPGPMLTRSLVSFTDRQLVPIFLEARAFRKRFSYGLIAIMLVAGTVLGVGFSSMISTPGRPPVEARAASEAPVPDATPADVDAVQASAPASTTAHASGSNPLSKIIEVTGIRIVMDPSQKPQVQYLVVNHSAARFPDATIYVTLRSADAHIGQAPLCRFSFAAPNLGPFEAKEMISAIEKTGRTVNLPDWQDLRAEVELGQ